MRCRMVPGWLQLVLLIIQVGVSAWSIGQRSWFFPDSDRYVMAAHNIAAHHMLYARAWTGRPVVGQGVQEYTIRPPAYPIVLAALGMRSSTDQPLLVLALQGMLAWVNVLMALRWWARFAQPSAVHWRWAAALVFFPAQFIYAGALMSEILLQTVVLGLAFAGLEFCRTPTTRQVVKTAVLLSLALLLKPVFYPLAGLLAIAGVGVAWWFRRYSWALLTFIPLVVTLLYMGWNQQRTGYFHFSSIAEINLLHYNAAGVVRQTEGAEAERQWVAAVLRAANQETSFAARQRLISERAVQVLRAHPLVYLRQHLQGMMTFFLDPGRFDLSQFLQLREPDGGGFLVQLRAAGLAGAAHVLRQLPVGLLAMLALIALANLGRLLLAIRGLAEAKQGPVGWRIGRWWVAGLIGYVAVLTGPLGAARFLVPVWPLLLLLALCGLKPLLPLVPQQDVATRKA